MTFIIYKATAPNGKAYIGLTKRSLQARWRYHINDAKRGSILPFHLAIMKYGADTFRIECLCECVDAREAKVCERALIAEHNTFMRAGHGYNMTIGGDGNHGWKPSAETRRKIGEKSRHRITTDEARANMSAAGKGKKKPRSPEHAAAIGRALKGRIISPEWRAKIGAASRGRTHSAETIEKIRASHRKRYGPKIKPEKSPLTKAQRSDIRRAWFAIPENRERHRQMLIKRNKETFWTEERRTANADRSRKRIADGALIQDERGRFVRPKETTNVIG